MLGALPAGIILLYSSLRKARSLGVLAFGPAAVRQPTMHYDFDLTYAVRVLIPMTASAFSLEVNAVQRVLVWPCARWHLR